MSEVQTTFTGDASSLNQTVQSADDNLKKLASSATSSGKKTEKALTGVGETSVKALKAIGPLQGAISKLSPTAASAIGPIMGLVSASEGLAAAGTAAGLSMSTMAIAAGPLVAVIGALAAAYYLYNRSLEENEEKQARATKGLEEQQTLARHAMDNQIAYNKLTGQSTRLLEAKQKNSEIDIAQKKEEVELTENLAAYNDKYAASEERLAAAMRNVMMNVNPESAAKYKEKLDLEMERHKEAEDDLRTTQHRIVASRNLAKEAQNLNIELAKQALTADQIAENEREAAEAKAKADEARRQREKKYADLLAETKAQLDALATMTEGLDGITQTAQESALTGVAKEKAAYQKLIQTIDEKARVAVDAGVTESYADNKAMEAKLAVTDAYLKTVTKITAEEEERQLKIREDAHEERMRLLKEEREAANEAYRQDVSNSATYAEASINGLMQVQEATLRSHDTNTAAGKKAALKQWKTQHALNEAQVIALGIVSGMQAAASAPWPQNLPAMIASSIESSLALGAIIATPPPKFHTGTTGFRPDEGLATLQKGEGVVTSQGMSKPGMKEAVHKANSGMSPMEPSGGNTTIVFRHKVYNRFMRENLRAGGPVADRFSQGKKIGHREVRQ